MNRKELVKKVAKATGLHPSAVEFTILYTFIEIERVFFEGGHISGKVSLSKFGAFTVVKSKGRERWNPKTKKLQKYPMTYRIRFKPSEGLVAALNNHLKEKS